MYKHLLCFIVKKSYTELYKWNNDRLIFSGHTKEKVVLKVVYGLLKEKSSRWDDIGQALGISYNDRQIIGNNENCIKLEAVLNKWIESKCSDVSWSHLIKTLKELQLCDLADEVKKHLRDDNYQDGSTSIDGKFCNARSDSITIIMFHYFV